MTPKKILFINPLQELPIQANQPEVFDQEIDYLPPLGILYLAGYLEKFSNHQVKVIDCGVEQINYQQLAEKIKDYQPDLVGLTALSFTLLDVFTILKIVKEINPAIKTFLGGPHPNIFPNETITFPFVDFIVLGEGEESTKELIDNLEQPEKLRQIKGIVYKNNNQIINTGKREFIQNLDKLSFPARHLTPYKKYFSIIAKNSPVTTMFSSRGCPYKCLFCDRPHLGKIFRARSAKNVVDEMELCKKMGINEILMYDDTFTIDRQRTIDICKEILKRDLKIYWDIRARVNTVDEEVLSLLKKAGCQRIHYGIEAGTQKILNVLRKGITLKIVEEAVKLTKRAGIQILAYFMIGNPTETKEDIEQTIKLAKKINPDYINVSITTPFPATDLYYLGLKTGVIKKDYWQDFAENPQESFVPPLWTENFTREELIDILKKFYKSFYKRPGYIIKKLLEIRSAKEFLRKAGAGLKIFKT